MFHTSANSLRHKCYFVSVAHCSYYSCFMLMKYIWLYIMHRTQEDLEQLCKEKKNGTHQVLINQIGVFILNSKKQGCTFEKKVFNKKILQLKDLRADADYEDAPFESEKSDAAIKLCDEIRPILKNYM
jgi:hypothetical protein